MEKFDKSTNLVYTKFSKELIKIYILLIILINKILNRRNMSNRLRLDFSLEFNDERAKFLEKYLANEIF